jgi:putative toxin-antitoxin system antitoxin component (TIGR02293 family)
MAQTQMVNEELARTLSFFEGGSDVETRSQQRDLSLQVLQAPKRGKKFFVYLSTKGEIGAPLLYPRAIDLLAERLAIDASTLLDVSRIPMRTFQRRQAEAKPLSETETDRVLRIARVASQAERVFGSAEKAQRWLAKSNRVLGAKPLEMLATDAGAHGVEAELNRIELSDFA